MSRITITNRTVLEVATLEDRVTPIVGHEAIAGAPPAFAPGALGIHRAADLVAPGKGYDGVVKISDAAGALTGTLFQTKEGQGFGHHIVTAAHGVTPTNKTTVTFTMPRAGVAAGVPIPIVLPADAAVQVNDQRFNQGNVFDISILRLVDPDHPAPSYDRLLVAPYNAEQFGLYNAADEINNDLPR